MDQWQAYIDAPDALVQSIRTWSKTVARPIVCVDYFDTVVTRIVAPEHTKVMASHQLARRLGLPGTGDELYAWRRDIELELCQKSARTTGELEFRFAEMSHLLEQRIETRFPNRNGGFDGSIYPSMLAIEVAVEKQVQTVCPKMFEVLEKLVRHGLQIVLVSDFYLPEQAFTDVLVHHGLQELFSNVFISCDYGMSKGSGRLYQYLCTFFQVHPQQLMMIGDNAHADIKMARDQGLRTVQVVQPLTAGGAKAEMSSQSHAAAWSAASDVVVNKHHIFPEMSLSLWRFTHLLANALLHDRVRNVFFLSKEGQLLKKLFDRYQEEVWGEKVIGTHYLLASRKSTFIASCRALEQESFSQLLDHYRDLSVREFLKSLNFEPDDVTSVCNELAADADRRLPNFRDMPLFSQLTALSTFRSLYEERRLTQRNNFIRYLDSFSIDYRTTPFCLVDVGWKGSIQDNIYHILDGQCSIHGYYIGSWNGTNRSSSNRKKGILFDDYPRPSDYLAVYNNNRSLLEMVLGADHGSADSYQTGDSPDMLAKTDKTTAVKDGCSLVKLCHVDQEQILYQEHIEPLQRQILAACSELSRVFMVTGMLPDDEWFARRHARMVYLPTHREISWFERLYHLENFGVFEFTRFETSHRFNALQRLINLKNIILHPGVLESGVWPPIILRRFGVGFWQRMDGRQRYLRTFGLLPKKQRKPDLHR